MPFQAKACTKWILIFLEWAQSKKVILSGTISINLWIPKEDRIFTANIGYSTC